MFKSYNGGSFENLLKKFEQQKEIVIFININLKILNMQQQ